VGSFPIGDGTLPFHSLSRADALRLRAFRDEVAAERFLISRSADVSEDDADALLAAMDSDTGEGLMKAMMILSGLRKPDPAPGECVACGQPLPHDPEAAGTAAVDPQRPRRSSTTSSEP
jgi:hypothetical protein